MTETPTLRDALIDAGTALLAEGGMPALTLRRAAARAGVSHAAPAHHFDGLPGLLTAIAARAFRRFADALQDAREAAGSDPFARLDGTCRGYLSFAADHAGLFHLMFISPEVARGDPELAPHADRSYRILREACAPFSPHPPVETLEIAVWSLVHGYAALGFGAPNCDRASGLAHLPPFTDLLRDLLAARQSATNPLAPSDDMGY